LSSLIDADELIPADGKDEMYDEVVSEIRDLENSIEADLQKFKKTLGALSQTMSCWEEMRARSFR